MEDNIESKEKELLAEAGMRNIKIVPRISDKWVAIQEVKRWLPTAFINHVECAKGIESLENFRREWDETNGKFKDHPKHDWAQHGYDGLETLARGLNAHGVITEAEAPRMIYAPTYVPRDAVIGI